MKRGHILENWLVKRAKLDPDKIALILEHADFTFSELNTTVQLFASKLSSCGISENDPIALFTDNCFNGYVAILALQQLGAQTILLDTQLSLKTLEDHIKDCCPKTILVSDSADTTYLDQIDWDKTFVSEVLSLKKNPNYRPIQDFNENKIVAIFYTPNAASFDTGVMLTYRNFFESAMGTALNLGITKQDTWVLTLPIFNVPAYSVIMRSLIYGIGVNLIECFISTSSIKC
ncbi:AMP-binding protein [Lactobacillus halodurans]|uniref:AMP-binding protein n=1 Tax=Companilactobacillus halodurans TaxID=2584183 RepID=A0A5P0ZYX8_9LACO|nr:AMP-binding protein [Companilactobacillus halodurans]